MTEFYDSNSATRAINTYLTYAKKLGNKDLVLLTIIAYKGETDAKYIEKVTCANPFLTLQHLEKLDLLHVDKSQKQYKYSLKEKVAGSKVFPENVMYVFTNALFNVGTYFKKYKITQWNNIAAIIEAPLLANKQSRVENFEQEVSCIGGNDYNKKCIKNVLVRIGVFKRRGERNSHYYTLNKHAYLMGAK